MWETAPHSAVPGMGVGTWEWKGRTLCQHTTEGKEPRDMSSFPL